MTQMPLRKSGFDSRVEGDVGNAVSIPLSTDLRPNTAPASARRAFMAAAAREAGLQGSQCGCFKPWSEKLSWHCILGVVVRSSRHLAAMFALLSEYTNSGF